MFHGAGGQLESCIQTSAIDIECMPSCRRRSWIGVADAVVSRYVYDGQCVRLRIERIIRPAPVAFLLDAVFSVAQEHSPHTAIRVAIG